MPEPLTISEAALLIKSGELSPTELLDQCLARIDRYEDRVRAWAFLDRDGAKEQAERLTKELTAGQYRGPLHGIPVGIKDIIDVFDLPTGCGSKLWANSYARRDATCVARLRQAGAVIVGKTVTTAYASFDPPPTRNPWNLDRTPGGSSSGSAAAVACGMCLAALATQTGGSITRPASYCGVCSLKPTHGRVSVDGVLPLAPSLDHVGVMANCVRDLAVVFECIAGADDRSPGTSVGHFPDTLRTVDFQLDAAHAPRPRYARLRGFFDELASPDIQAAMTHLGKNLRNPPDRNSPGRLAIDPVTNLTVPASFVGIHAAQRRVMAVEAAKYHRGRLARHPDDYPPRFRELLEEGLGCPAVDYADALERKWDGRADVDNLTQLPVTCLLTPAATGPAPDAATTGDPAMNAPWSYTGSPTVSFPIGWSADGLPLSGQAIGAARTESSLLAAAAWAERLARFERRPLPL